jgi:small ligand-binding sensory domain FIST
MFRVILLSASLSVPVFIGNVPDAAISGDAFVQTAENQVLTATIMAHGVSCPRVKLDDGQEVSLMGVARLSPIGGRVTLQGQWVTRSTCQQGRTFHVSKITPMQK